MPEHLLYSWIFANGEGYLNVCNSCKEHIKTIILGLHLSEQEKALYLNNQNKANNLNPKQNKEDKKYHAQGSILKRRH